MFRAFSIRVMDDDGKPLKAMTVSGALWSACGLLLAVGIGLIVVICCDYARLKREAPDLAKLHTQVALGADKVDLQRSQLDGLKIDIDQIRKRMVTLQQSAGRIRRVAGLTDNDRRLGYIGIGGPAGKDSVLKAIEQERAPK